MGDVHSAFVFMTVQASFRFTNGLEAIFGYVFPGDNTTTILDKALEAVPDDCEALLVVTVNYFTCSRTTLRKSCQGSG